MEAEIGTTKQKDCPKATGQLTGVRIVARDDADSDAHTEADNLNTAIDAYMSSFTMLPDNKCPGCERRLGGLLGSFQWGLCWGEGRCSNCGWPCRGYHSPKDDEGQEIFTSPLALLLPYHPECVAERSQE